MSHSDSLLGSDTWSDLEYAAKEMHFNCFKIAATRYGVSYATNPVFEYEDWMAPLARIWMKDDVETLEILDAYAAGHRGDFEAVNAFVGLCELAR